MIFDLIFEFFSLKILKWSPWSSSRLLLNIFFDACWMFWPFTLFRFFFRLSTFDTWNVFKFCCCWFWSSSIHRCLMVMIIMVIIVVIIIIMMIMMMMVGCLYKKKCRWTWFFFVCCCLYSHHILPSRIHNDDDYFD